MGIKNGLVLFHSARKKYQRFQGGNRMTQNNAATTDCKTDLTEQFLFWAVQ